MPRSHITSAWILDRAMDVRSDLAARGGLHVWWDMDADVFLVVPVDCGPGRLLADRLDAESVRHYVGRFQPPCSVREIQAAMFAHWEGRLT